MQGWFCFAFGFGEFCLVNKIETKEINATYIFYQTNQTIPKQETNQKSKKHTSFMSWKRFSFNGGTVENPFGDQEEIIELTGKDLKLRVDLWLGSGLVLTRCSHLAGQKDAMYPPGTRSVKGSIFPCTYRVFGVPVFDPY